MDAYGLLPPAIRANLEAEEHAARGRALDKALRQYDPELSLVFVRPLDQDRWQPPANVIPGRWHVRQILPAPHAARFYPITNPDGSYREPDFGVLEEMKKRDLRRPGAVDEMVDNAPSRVKGDTLADEQRRDAFKADFKTAKRVAGDGGLTARKWGKGS